MQPLRLRARESLPAYSLPKGNSEDRLISEYGWYSDQTQRLFPDFAPDSASDSADERFLDAHSHVGELNSPGGQSFRAIQISPSSEHASGLRYALDCMEECKTQLKKQNTEQAVEALIKAC